jgi:hypothetical protein
MGNNTPKHTKNLKSQEKPKFVQQKLDFTLKIKLPDNAEADLKEQAMRDYLKKKVND